VITDLAARRRSPPFAVSVGEGLFRRRGRSEGLLTALLFFWSLASPADAADRVVLQLRSDHQFEFAGYYAAQWEGYYAAEGLAVEVRPGVGPDGMLIDVTKELALGRADFGIAGVDALVARSRGVPLVVLASIFQHSGAEIFTRPGIELLRPADLARLRVQSAHSPVLDAELVAMLQAEGIDPEDVPLEPVPPPYTVPQRFEPLFSGEVDATPAYSIAILWAAREKGIVLGRLRPSAYGVDFYGDSIIARQSIVDQRPALAESFVRASLRGWQYALEHPEVLVQTIASRLPRSLPVSDPVAYNRFVAERVRDLTMYPVVALGHLNRERWKHMNEVLVRAGVVGRGLELDELVFDPQARSIRERERRQNTLVAALGAALLALILWGLWNRRHRDRERARADRELRESAETLRSIAENLPNLHLSVINADFTVGLTGGQEFLRQGLDPTQLVGRPVAELFEPYGEEALAKVLDAYRRTFAGEPQSFELQVEDQDQLYRTTPLPGAEGGIPRILALVENVTERKQAREALLTLNARYARQEAALSQLTRRSAMLSGGVGPLLREVTEVMARTLVVERVGIWRYNATRTALVCLDLFELSAGRHQSGAELQAAGYPMYFRALDEAEFIAAHDARRDPRTAEFTVSYLEPNGVTSMLDTPLHLRGSVAGALCCEHVGSARRWTPDEQSFAVAVTHLVSVLLAHEESQILGEQLRQSQKMEAIGQLAGGVAHDFNNILTTIMMQADLAGLADSVPAETRELIQEIKVAAERAASLTGQLLAFSRRQVMQPRAVDLNRVVSNLGKMVQRIVGEDVGLRLQSSPRPVTARVDQGMIDQVLLNLVVNSRDAMPGGGRLVIETGERELSEAEAQGIPEASSGRYVWIRVTDTGCGIAEEQLSRIFEPFFTTKEPGKGTGLGLATVFGIVKQHGGFVEVRSKVGLGTAVEIDLPAVESGDRDEPAESIPQRAEGGSETILVVEDEPAVRRLTRIVLEGRGYRVIEAANGVEALRVWKERGSEVELLLTDMVMPEGVGGRELAEKLQAECPALRVIFTSGYSAEIAGRELSLGDGQNFLQKPFSPQRLLDAVRRSLDAGAT
jgi:PAS domain S-box-containing protein